MDIIVLCSYWILNVKAFLFSFLVEACKYLEEHIHTEGLFRKSGSFVRLKALKVLLFSFFPAHAFIVWVKVFTVNLGYWDAPSNILMDGVFFQNSTKLYLKTCNFSNIWSFFYMALVYSNCIYLYFRINLIKVKTACPLPSPVMLQDFSNSSLENCLSPSSQVNSRKLSSRPNN